MFFGLQGLAQWLLIDAWNDEFFHKPKAEVVGAYQRRMDLSLGQGAVDVSHVAALHDLGYLPLRIKALPEGSRVEMRIPLLTVVNTHPDFYWVTNYIETQLSAELWKAITSATIAYEYRRLFTRYAERTGADTAMLPWLGMISPPAACRASATAPPAAPGTCCPSAAPTRSPRSTTWRRPTRMQRADADRRLRARDRALGDVHGRRG